MTKILNLSDECTWNASIVRALFDYAKSAYNRVETPEARFKAIEFKYLMRLIDENQKKFKNKIQHLPMAELGIL